MKRAAQPTPTPPRRVRCPTCAGQGVYAPSNAYRPFCSERCKNLDLGAWASEHFRVASQDEPTDLDLTDQPGLPRPSASQ